MDRLEGWPLKRPFFLARGGLPHINGIIVITAMATIIDMPKLSDTMTAGTLARWLKKEGERVTSGDKLAEVETDKATMELDNFDDGVILKHYVKEGDSIPVGAPICAIGTAGEAPPEVTAKAVTATPPAEVAKQEARVVPVSEDGQSAAPPCVPPAPPAETAAAAPAQPVAPAGPSNDRIKASPLAKKIAAEHGLHLALVKGTGPGGRIVQADVETYLRSGSSIAVPPEPAPAPPMPVEIKTLQHAAAAVPSSQPPMADREPGRPLAPAASLVEPQPKAAPAPAQAHAGGDVPVSTVRAIIARRLVESKTTIPHFYLEMEIDAAPLTALRESINASFASLPSEQGGIKLTVNDFILRASALTLIRHPAVNRSWMGETIRQHASANVAFGVAIEDGLVTPVVRDAHLKGLRQLSLEAKELIMRARSRKLKPDEMSGSTFTVTNLGMYGISNFYAIINPPNAAILSIGAVLKKPIVGPNDQIVVGQRMSLGLACDHRVIDGANGAEFLVSLKELLENPTLLLV